MEEVINRKSEDQKIKKSEKYWKGPAGVLITNYIGSVPSIDKVNRMSINGGSTQLWNPPSKHYTEEEYREKFAKCIDGVYYWDEDKS